MDNIQPIEPKKGTTKIDDVKPGINLPKLPGGWVDVLKAFNPLGTISEMYANTLAYKIECKRLDAELLRIKEQSAVINKIIDNNFKLKIMELETRRAELASTYATINKQLEDLHIERMAVLEMAQMCTKKALESGISPEERTNAKEMAIEMTKQLPLFGDKANESLKNLIQALPPVNIPKLLTAGTE